jgi:hypothetical protein
VDDEFGWMGRVETGERKVRHSNGLRLHHVRPEIIIESDVLLSFNGGTENCSLVWHS